ncbi:MAG: monovalent cation/H+ antiporter complex subunit F [Gammaproteobacteria bacterium]|nr:monovalent cation/H+ antiporter complex subunit F [Gammaproteobacteria bacterium]MCW8841578.1 monovalent cation/H+ antiporter complex subunit F [Gammaproteobacteria bacterium]MCW8927574.1 monovalent cation/H+ antiporter complex subunit F [Gammaproteobacteria bacterium]MCW8958288.1 monovalent cation/H+ antiporter complex subunit F [Gammaproteobacteria bacterium]MCW8972905.1 monovalent cation/H+ antiporter complex subunit F [Gammaproteobacteria bacterium]
MSEVLFIAALLLLLTILAGLWRVLRGPAPADRMLAVQLFGTSGVGILLLLAEAMDERALRDVALLFALLAVLGVVAFVRWRAGAAQ